nr:wall-associated receptor kinase-like 1 [Ipomoea batatas]GMD97388.1 wall-associated receptor kinase-like 1 [Ipomoea batatas]GMD97392.1 wall-associated receptor kinase-like 1 [Ipomoea batatas]
MVMMMSFTVMLTLAFEYNMSYEAARYKQEGISMVPKGCPDKCGNVSIYYPFGSMEGCYLGEWFHINCTTSSDGVEKPYLSFFSNDSSIREILGISFESWTITLKQSISPVCQTTTGPADGSNITIIPDTKLSQTSFFYSDEYLNKFMLLGCGNVLLTSPGYNIVGGCTSLCGKFTERQHLCYGINCCQIQLSTYYYDDIKTYQVNFTNSAALHACSYAFFAHRDWFAESFTGSRRQEELVVPVVWLWSIPQLPPSASSDYCNHRINSYGSSYSDNYYCYCPYPKIGNPLIANGCHVMAWKRSEAGRPMVPNGCQDKCGTVNIYYPFGIGNENGNGGCYLNKWFLINCTKSSDGSEILGGIEKPYLSSISGGVEILGMSYHLQTITIKESISPSCQPAKGNNNFSIIQNSKLSETPFSYSFGNNFMLFGCGNAFITMPGEELEKHGYKLNCSSKNTTAPKTAHDCQGINCNHLTFDYDVNTYQVNFTHDSSINAAACNYAFFLSDSSSLPPTLQSLPSRQQEVVVVPVELRWTITQQDVPSSYYSAEYCAPIPTFINPQLQRHNYLLCSCQNGYGNAYFSGGCEPTYSPDKNHKISVKKLSAIIGVSASFGLVSLIWACVILYKAIQKRKMKKLRQNFFKHNGGLLLQQQLLAKEGTIEKTKIFTASELDKATDHFSADRIVGRENRVMEIVDVKVIEQGKKEDVVAMAWLAQSCLNLNGKKRPTMKEVAAELDTIKASHSHLPLAAMETLEIESDFIV